MTWELSNQKVLQGHETHWTLSIFRSPFCVVMTLGTAARSSVQLDHTALFLHFCLRVFFWGPKTAWSCCVAHNTARPLLCSPSLGGSHTAKCCTRRDFAVHISSTYETSWGPTGAARYHNRYTNTWPFIQFLKIFFSVSISMDTEKKALLYKIAWGKKVKPETLMKHGLPLDLHCLHPIVLQRKKLTTNLRT